MPQVAEEHPAAGLVLVFREALESPARALRAASERRTSLGAVAVAVALAALEQTA
jgi:hypothetical protein